MPTEEFSVEQYADDMRLMFNTAGWEWIVTECREAIATSQDVMLMHDAADLHFQQGRVALARHILSLPDAVADLDAEADDA